jgi:hypothetical protein
MGRSAAGQAPFAIKAGVHAALTWRKAMRATILSMAVLLGIATLTATDARATSVRVVILQPTVEIPGRRHHHKPQFDHRQGPGKHYGKQGGQHHGPRAFVPRRVTKGAVIVRPAYGLLRHRHLPRYPLIRNGGFARRSYH